MTSAITTVAGPSTQPPTTPEDDTKVLKVEFVISSILRVGVLLSTLLIVTGSALSFGQHPEYEHRSSSLSPLTRTGSQFPHSLGAVWHGVTLLQGQAIVALGLLALIGTPVVRVAASVVAFRYQRDRTFVIITATVLTLLVASFALGKAGG
jgi:uncharacterized membrane protein